ncbi:MAG: putative lipid II flippase FtsW [Thiohalomonadales bacterium]
MLVRALDSKLRFPSQTNPRKSELVMDYWLFMSAITLLLLGLVMVASASASIADRNTGDAFYYVWRQMTYIIIGLVAAWYTLKTKINIWQKLNPILLFSGVLLLILVIVVGREVNGSTRWLSLGFINVQPSEIVKLFMVMYMSGYLVRHGDEVRNSFKGFFKPIIIVSILSILFLLEPDFGSTAVLAVTTLGMLFIGGMRIRQFVMLLGVMLAGFTIVAMAAPYRMERLRSFLNPWEDPFNTGFQLTQALIAFGKGEWFGVGLGGSIQKLFYLPEAHTDFLFAVLAEELGLVGAIGVISLFAIIVYRAFWIGYRAYLDDRLFSAYLAHGLGLLIATQAFTNIGVNLGVLPTKGLPLPLMSYGGSSVVVTCIACAVLLRIHHENQSPQASYMSRRHASLGEYG